jgi:hypothetical protein
VPGNEAADRAAREAAGHNPTAQANPERQPEPEPLKTLMATTKPIIRQTMRDEWRLSGRMLSTAESSSNSGFDKGMEYLLRTLAHTERSALSLHRCAQARSAYAHTSIPSTRSTRMNANAALGARQYATSSWNVETGPTNDTDVGRQATMCGHQAHTLQPDNGSTSSQDDLEDRTPGAIRAILSTVLKYT